MLHPAHFAVRRGVGVIRLAVGLLVLASITTQITDQVIHDAFEPEEYFSYFTIQSSLMNIVALLVGGLLAVRQGRDPESFTAVRMAIVAYAAVTGSVYAVLLRGIPSEGFVGIQWPNEVIHVWVPIFIALDWLFAPGRPALAWSRLWFVVAYPLAWVVFTLFRGSLDGWFPYPFLEPDGPGGWSGVLVYVLAIAVFILGVGAAAITVSRLAVRSTVPVP